MLKRLTVIFLCTPLLLLFVSGDTFFSHTIAGLCSKVLDGDTIIVNNQKIRLALIDAPEKQQLSYDKVAIGKISKMVLESLVLHKRVHVEYRNRGKYGRIIGRVWIKKSSDKFDINLSMIKQGQAVLYGWNLPLNYKVEEYKAKISRRGIFGLEGFDMPYIFRKKRGP